MQRNLAKLIMFQKKCEEENYFPQTGKLRSFEYKSLPYENKIADDVEKTRKKCEKLHTFLFQELLIGLINS